MSTPLSCLRAPLHLRQPQIPLSALSYRWDTLPPTPRQLKHASEFFSKEPPKFLWSAPKFKTMDWGDSPEVCFLGRSNVGKSSLLNALLNKKIAHASSKPGRTRAMNAFAVGGSEDNGSNRLVVLDMPGYGKGGQADWGTQILKYLDKRKELKRAFLLIDAEHGVKDSDRFVIDMFKEHRVPYQIVLSKVDRALFGKKKHLGPAALEGRLEVLKGKMNQVKNIIQPDTEEDGGAVGEVLACSSERSIEGKRMGIDDVRFAMLHAAGLELRPKTKLVSPEVIVPFEEIFGTDGSGR